MKQYRIKVNGNAYDITVQSVENGVAHLVVNGKEVTAELDAATAAAAAPAAPVAPSAPAAGIAAAPAAPASAPAAAGTGSTVTSPLPGVIIGISVAVGDKVAAGQTVATLEAMKMENAIEAETAGTVTAIHVQKGDSVLEGAKIVTIA